MPITFVNTPHPPICGGNQWTIVNEDNLAEIVAWVSLGQIRHSLKIINHNHTADPSVASAALEALKNLDPGTTKATRYHRDGWVFQIISWVTMHLQVGPGVKGAYPHMIRAHKGLDGLFLTLSDDQDVIEQVIICEDKATENPINILGKVWTGIKEVESGEKDAQLTEAITTILERYQVANIDQLIEAVHWKDKKGYRVAITTLPEHNDLQARESLFINFPVVAPGADLRRRHAETLMLDDVRSWMDSFCAKVVTYITEKTNV